MAVVAHALRFASSLARAPLFWPAGLGVLVGLLGFLGLASVRAQAPAAFAPASAAAPGKQAPLRLIVPFAPGTGIDLIARQLGPKLAERLGRPVVLDNRAGASGNLGTGAVVRAPADGSTLLVTVTTMVMNRALYPKLSFDPLKDLEPVTLTSWGQRLQVTSKASGIGSGAELVARAKARPGALNCASPGNGTPRRYETHRAPRAARVLRESTEMGELYHIVDAQPMREAFVARDIARSRNEWLYPYDPWQAPLA